MNNKFQTIYGIWFLFVSWFHKIVCHTYNTSLREIKSYFGEQLIFEKSMATKITRPDDIWFLFVRCSQQDGVSPCNAGLREIVNYFDEQLISSNLWQPRSSDLMASDFFLWVVSNKVVCLRVMQVWGKLKVILVNN